MNYVVGGIPPAVAVLQESWHLHTVLYHYIASYRVFVPVVRSFFPKAPLHILSIDAARDLSGFLNGVECISEYKLSPFLLYGFLFQEKRIQAYLVFLKDMFGNIFLIDIGHVLKDGLFH